MAQSLRTIDTVTGPMFVDFKLEEIRAVSMPSLALPFVDLQEETKAAIRGLRAEFGPNCYIEGLDD